jgi:hypothetical protein
MGVGNNIQQLTSNFGYLSTAAGGTVPALKLMVSSLAGPAGILLAVSAVTSLLTVYGDKLFKSSDSVSKLREEQEKLTKSLEDYRLSLTGVNKAKLEGNIAAADELVQLRTLKAQIENTNISQDLRLDGVKQLQKLYPSYFADIDKEKLLNGQVATTYDLVSAAILKRAKATAAQGLLIKNAENEIILQDRLAKLNENIAKEDEKRAKTALAFQESTKQAQLRGINPAVNAYIKDISTSNKLLKEQAEITKQLGQISEENARFESIISANIAIDPTQAENSGSTLAKNIKQGFTNEFESLDDIFGIKTSVQKTLDGFRPDFSNFNVTFNKLGDIVEFSLKDSVSKMKPQLAEMEKLMIDFSENVTNIINNGVIDAFASIGRGIGDAIANGTNIFASVGANLLKIIGQVATQLGEAAIGIGVAMLAIKLSFSNPFTAIAAGVALVALGAALGGIANNALRAQGSSSSGAVTGQGSSSSGGNFSSNAGGFSSSSSGGEFVFRVRGRELVAVLENELGANKRLGGVGSIIGG